VAALVQRRAARVVQRQAQAERDARLDLAYPLKDLLRGEQVDPAELVVVSPVAPRRVGRAPGPPLRHDSSEVPGKLTDRYNISRARRSAPARSRCAGSRWSPHRS